MPKHVEKPVIQVRERQMPVTTATVKEEMVEVPKVEAMLDTFKNSMFIDSFCKSISISIL
jgi:hypothetical protein